MKTMTPPSRASIRRHVVARLVAVLIAAPVLGGCVVLTLSEDDRLHRVPMRTVVEHPQTLLGLPVEREPVLGSTETKGEN